MDKKISGFNIADSNMLRRAIAKKKADVLDKAKELFFTKGKECGASETLLNYVWYVQFKKSFGYSFSQNHCHPYAGICLQEMNLACKYPMIFWNTACLCINAGADENNDNNKNTNYGKIAKAIGNMKSTGQKVALPNINTAGFGFEPDVKSNSIVFGLMGISGVGDNEARMIVSNQPYTSFDDFTNRCPVGITTTINLIKAGCFNELEHSTPTDVLKYYINKISKPLIKLSLSQITTLNDLGLLTQEQKQYELRLYHFREYIFKKKFLVRQDGKSANTQWYRLEKNHAEPFFYEFFETNMVEDKDYEYSNEGEILVKRGSIDREYKRMMKNFEQNVLSNIDMIAAVNKVRFNEIWNEKASGTEAKWYMSTLSYYPEEHELSHVNMDEYSISSFKDLPEEPEVVEYRTYRGKEVPRFKLSRICGTVLDKDKNKNTITLLTPDSGVVMCKFPRGTFSFYDKRISELDQNTGKKTVLENSWFGRGCLLILTGVRRGDRFITKKYADSVFKHTLTLITDVKEDGTLSMQYERIGSEEE